MRYFERIYVHERKCFKSYYIQLIIIYVKRDTKDNSYLFTIIYERLNNFKINFNIKYIGKIIKYFLTSLNDIHFKHKI